MASRVKPADDRGLHYTPVMDQVPPPPVPTQLIVFADDWGRHPSSSQHLIRELLPHYPTLWVNTVGTRRPSLSSRDIKRGIQKLWSYIDSDGSINVNDKGLPDNLTVVDPLMYPGFRRAWQRRFNTNRVAKAIQPNLIPDCRHVVITTLPVTADLLGKLQVDRWLYYCVDNYAQWPGTDSFVMQLMEEELVPKADAVACVSEVLQQRAVGMGADQPSLIQHGVHTSLWQTPATDSVLNARWPSDDQHIALFWGLIQLHRHQGHRESPTLLQALVPEQRAVRRACRPGTGQQGARPEKDRRRRDRGPRSPCIALLAAQEPGKNELVLHVGTDRTGGQRKSGQAALAEAHEAQDELDRVQAGSDRAQRPAQEGLPVSLGERAPRRRRRGGGGEGGGGGGAERYLARRRSVEEGAAVVVVLIVVDATLTLRVRERHVLGQEGKRGRR